jgi:5-methylcytosine-specific restriction endonuclease McrA
MREITIEKKMKHKNHKKIIRSIFRTSVFKRDNYTCKVCNTKCPEEELDAHHIMDRSLMPKGGYVKRMASLFARKDVI